MSQHFDSATMTQRKTTASSLNLTTVVSAVERQRRPVPADELRKVEALEELKNWRKRTKEIQ